MNKKIIIIVSLLFLTVMLVPAHGKDLSSMTEEEINKLPEEEVMKLPALEAMIKMTNAKKHEFIAILELVLLDLRYYYSKPTGRENHRLTEAIKAFQKSIGTKPTGVLLMGEFEELTNRHDRLNP